MPEKQKTCGVLIVEDDHVSRLALMSILSRLEYRVNAAGSVAEGLASLDGQHCVILDLDLPDGSGTTVLERIRSENRPMRVAVATATVDEALLTEAKKLRPDLLLRKPYDINVLLAWLEASG